MTSEVVLLARWPLVMAEIMARTEKFPKRVRFTFSSRIDNLCLDVLERLVEAAYSRRKERELADANLQVEKLRVLLRITHDLEYLDHKGYEHLSRLLDECGRMVGGWMRSRKGSP